MIITDQSVKDLSWARAVFEEVRRLLPFDVFEVVEVAFPHRLTREKGGVLDPTFSRPFSSARILVVKWMELWLVEVL